MLVLISTQVSQIVVVSRCTHLLVCEELASIEDLLLLLLHGAASLSRGHKMLIVRHLFHTFGYFMCLSMLINTSRLMKLILLLLLLLGKLVVLNLLWS